jgi:hypothetical protein
MKYIGKSLSCLEEKSTKISKLEVILSSVEKKQLELGALKRVLSTTYFIVL